MSTTDKATPRPWLLGGDSPARPAGHVFSGRARVIAGCMGYSSNSDVDIVEENLANAALIVRAVNNHEALVEALQDALYIAQEAHGAPEWCGECTEAKASANTVCATQHSITDSYSLLASARGEA